MMAGLVLSGVSLSSSMSSSRSIIQGKSEKLAAALMCDMEGGMDWGTISGGWVGVEGGWLDTIHS